MFYLISVADLSPLERYWTSIIVLALLCFVCFTVFVCALKVVVCSMDMLLPYCYAFYLYPERFCSSRSFPRS